MHSLQNKASYCRGHNRLIVMLVVHVSHKIKMKSKKKNVPEVLLRYWNIIT